MKSVSSWAVKPTAKVVGSYDSAVEDDRYYYASTLFVFLHVVLKYSSPHQLKRLEIERKGGLFLQRLGIFIRVGELRGCFMNNTERWVIFFVLASELLAKRLLKLDFIKRLGIFSCVNLCKVRVIGGRLRYESSLFISELSEEFCWIASPYLQITIMVRLKLR